MTSYAAAMVVFNAIDPTARATVVSNTIDSTGDVMLAYGERASVVPVFLVLNPSVWPRYSPPNTVVGYIEVIDSPVVGHTEDPPHHTVVREVIDSPVVGHTEDPPHHTVVRVQPAAPIVHAARRRCCRDNWIHDSVEGVIFAVFVCAMIACLFFFMNK